MYNAKLRFCRMLYSGILVFLFSNIALSCQDKICDGSCRLGNVPASETINKVELERMVSEAVDKQPSSPYRLGRLAGAIEELKKNKSLSPDYFEDRDAVGVLVELLASKLFPNPDRKHSEIGVAVYSDLPAALDWLKTKIRALPFYKDSARDRLCLEVSGGSIFVPEEEIERGVKAFIAAGVDVIALDNFGSTPLLCTLKNGRTSSKIVEILLNSGARVNFRNWIGENPLSVVQNKYQFWQQSLSQLESRKNKLSESEIQEKKQKIQLALDETKAIEELLKKHSQIQTQKEQAELKQKLEILQVSIPENPNLESVQEICRRLIEKVVSGIPDGLRDPQLKREYVVNQLRPFFHYEMFQTLDVFNFVVNFLASLKELTGSGSSLYMATSLHTPQAIRWLEIEKAQHSEASQTLERLLLDRSLKSNFSTSDQVKVLLQAGVNPNVEDHLFGGTPLMRAAMSANLEVLLVLKKYGARPDIKSTSKAQGADTALGLAKFYREKAEKEYQSDYDKIIHELENWSP